MENKPKKGEFLEVLLRSSQTIFSTKDAALLWGEGSSATVSDRLKKYAKAGKLVRVHRGLYAKDQHYDRFELATRIYTPSYISFETVLTLEGVNFQYYETIFVASYVNRELVINGQKMRFIRMKDYVLSETAGINNEKGYSIATKERAVLDRLYVSKSYYFDNVHGLDLEKLFALLPLYHNKRLAKRVSEYFKADTNDKSP